MFTDMFPPLCNRIKIQLCDSDLTSDEVIATHFIQLSQIMDPGGDIEGSLCCNACGRFRSPFCRVFRLNLKCLRQKWDLVRKKHAEKGHVTSPIYVFPATTTSILSSTLLLHANNSRKIVYGKTVCVCVCVCARLCVRACVCFCIHGVTVTSLCLE